MGNESEVRTPASAQYKAVILSVGGTAAPLWKTVVTVAPEVVVLLASQQSVPTCVEVQTACSNQGVVPEFEHVLVERPDNLTECYQRGLEAAERVKAKGIPAEEVLVDITGGTKVMSVGLGLATVREGFRFNYVSGNERADGGLGVVVDGSEFGVLTESPWHLFAVEEKAALAHQFNTYQFAAAGETVERLLDREGLRPHDRHLMQMLRDLVVGYAAWDRFDHRTACEKLRAQAEPLRSYAQDRYERSLRPFAQGVADNLRFLQDLQQASRGFKGLVSGHVADLLSNADRRAEEGKYDDAVARLYRAAEMAGQIAFEACFGCTTADVARDKLPEDLREEFVRKYAAGDGTVKLPLMATFEALAAAGDPLGRRFGERREELRGVLQGRNASILAHGTQPLENRHYDAFRSLVLDLTGRAQEDLVRFPRLET